MSKKLSDIRVEMAALIGSLDHSRESLAYQFGALRQAVIRWQRDLELVEPVKAPKESKAERRARDNGQKFGLIRRGA